MGDVGCRVVVDAYHRAITDGVPIIGLWHSGLGARLAEGACCPSTPWAASSR